LTSSSNSSITLVPRYTEWLKAARAALQIEAQAIIAAAARLDGNLTRAVEIILSHMGKIVISGIGKSGHIGKKIAATLCSTGTPAVFLHATEAVHGDVGIYTPGDPTILISKSGTTIELMRLIPILRQFKSPIIALVGNIASPLAHKADVVLDAHVTAEGDPLGIVPTSSTIVALAVGDGLACALMHARRFSESDYARLHPGGQIGRNLTLTVGDIMQRGDAVAWVKPDAVFREIIVTMTKHPLGAACVVDRKENLLGIITDGDIRRALLVTDDLDSLRADQIMTHRPISVSARASLQEALRLMEGRTSQISVLPVREPDSKRCLGIIRLHDVYQQNIE
jgi:arabinose-5-phosphate isomerase